MSLLEEPEIRKAYDKCKFTVKVWEHKFIKEFKRIPSQLDMKEAPRDVREAYKIYVKLKSAVLEESFRGVEGFEDDEELEISQKDKPDPFEKQECNSLTNVDNISNELKDTNVDTLPLMETKKTDEISENVWGAHLNNKKVVKKEKPKLPQLNPNANITKKLFCGSKFNKRNPRKSLSFSQRTKSDVTSFDEGSQSQPAFSTSVDLENESQSQIEEKIFKNETFHVVNDGTKIASQPINLLHNAINNEINKPLKSVDIGWLQRVAQHSGIELELPTPNEVQQSENTKVDYDSEDIIEESDEESNFDDKQLHVAKKRKLENLTQIQIEKNEKNVDKAVTENLPINTNKHTEMNKTSDKPHYEKIENKIDNVLSSGTVINLKTPDISNISLTGNAESITDTNFSSINLVLNKTTPEKCNVVLTKNSKAKPRQKKSPRVKKTTKVKKDKNPTCVNKETAPRRSSRSTRAKVTMEESPSDTEVDPFADEGYDDPDFRIEETKKFEFIDESEKGEDEKSEIEKSKGKKTRKIIKGRKKPPNVDNSEGREDKPFELEFSVKPRIVAPRYKSIKKVLMEKQVQEKSTSNENDATDTVPKDPKLRKAKEVLEKKIASGRLNENFVRIDIQKKVFVRGKRSKSISQIKKARWRSKKAKALSGPNMDMRGCDGGMLTCFNCGQIGHFAQNCKASKGDNLLPLESTEGEEECPFPTLEEASKLAKEHALNVRTSNLTHTQVTNEDNLEENCFDDDFDEELLKHTLQLEEEIKKLDVKMYLDTVTVVKPYYDLNEDGTIIATPPDIFNVLKKFGHDTFRPGQEQAIMRILSGKSTLVTLSTGSGKSLCYQLPAYMYSMREPCISLVISPLVSLMDDQVTNIAKFMKAASLHSNQTKVQRQKILEAVSSGELSVLLVSPEAVVAGDKTTGFGSFLRRLPPIAFACIDEVHCVSQWSHNFRPSYLLICRVLRESLGVKTILGLTATATRTTRDSIIKHIAIPDGDQGVISDIPLPNNLVLTVSKDKERDYALLQLLSSERFKNCKSIIIYCTRRDECERIAAFLRTGLKVSIEKTENVSNKKRKRLNLVAEPYHAGLPSSRRRTIQNAFMSGELRIVVATIAFGMGINKSDIRSVIHFNMPSSFETYVQEVGRAGRDGLEALCHVFLDPLGRDENELRRHIHANSIDRHVVRKLLEKVFMPCSCTGECLKHEVGFSIEETIQSLDIPEENISTLLCYLELHPNKYVELLSPAYTHCKIISYGGPNAIRKAAKECPPLAMALALYKNKSENDQNITEFPIIEVASAMGWESGICKHKLKNLEWTTVNNQPRRSQLSVQFSNLGFRLLAPGNLTGDQLDEALDNLYNRVVEQEHTALKQLNAIHKALLEVAKSSFQQSDKNGDEVLKVKIREYFDSSEPFKLYEKVESKTVNEEFLIGDIHAIINMYRDNNFNGRAIARIFHGIQSPNYPAAMWGRCKFWRSHMDIDFNFIIKIATREIIKMR